MPINETYPLEEVLTVLDEHIKKTRRKVYIAYVMLRGVNDSRAHAEAVTKLLKGRGPWDHLYHVNVIRYHPAVGAPRQYAQSDERQIKMFYDVLQAAGVRVTVRQSFGVDIDAACGQLYGEYRTRGQPSI